MGGVCPGCVRGTAQEEKAYYQTSQYPPWPQQPLPQVVQQRPRPQPEQKQQPQQVILRPQQIQQPQQVLRPQQIQQAQQVLRSQQAQQPQQQQRTTEEDRARSDEARANAAIAAQKRAEAFEKSAGGRAARTAIAAAKANPLPSRNEPGLRWTVG